MNNRVRIGIGSGVVALLGAALAPATAAEAATRTTPSASITLNSASLFTPTDADSAAGYLQVEMIVSYLCNNSGATLSGSYGPASQSIEFTNTTCDSTSHVETVYAQVPESINAKPVSSGVSYSFGVSLDGNSEGAGESSMSGSTVLPAPPTGAPAITDMFPPYHFHFTKDDAHPASRIIAHWLPPLTTGSHKLSGFRIFNYSRHVHLLIDPALRKYTLKNLKPNEKYNFGLGALSSDGDETTSAAGIGTLPKSQAHLSLHADHHTVSSGHSVKLSGQLKPAHGGHVILQTRQSGHWKTLATARLHHGAFHHTIDVGSTKVSIRAVVHATPDVRHARSTVVHITVD